MVQGSQNSKTKLQNAAWLLFLFARHSKMLCIEVHLSSILSSMLCILEIISFISDPRGKSVDHLSIFVFQNSVYIFLHLLCSRLYT